MAFTEDVIDWVTSEITTIGLADGPTAGDEISGNGYTALAPDYDAAADGSADLSTPLEFDGPANGDITHAIFRNAGGVWFIQELTEPRTFNSDGRFDLTTAQIDHSVVSG